VFVVFSIAGRSGSSRSWCWCHIGGVLGTPHPSAVVSACHTVPVTAAPTLP